MRSWKDTAARVGERVGGRTLVELLGKERLVIERHLGVKSYSDGEIWVGATFGNIRITGEKLGLCCMSREQLCISGIIDTVALVGRNSHGSLE